MSDGAAAGEEPRVGRSATVLAPLTDFTETQIVQVPATKIKEVLELTYDCQKHIATEPRSDRRPSNESAFQSFGRCLPWT